MALVPVEVVNGSGQTVRLLLEENGEQHEYLRKQVRADSLESVTVVKPAPRKPAPAK